MASWEKAPYHAITAALDPNRLKRNESLIEIYHEIMDRRRASKRHNELLGCVVSEKISLCIGRIDVKELGNGCATRRIWTIVCVCGS